jgi:hypothetical protein
MPDDLPKCPLQFLYDEENEAWLVRSGDITVTFFEPGELIVAGTDVTAQVTYDRITEDRGLRFQDFRHREYEYRIRKDSEVKE